MSTPQSRLARLDLPRIASAVAVVVGLMNIAGVLTPGLTRRVELISDFLPGAVVSASAAVSVAVGVLMLGLAAGLARGKRRAWRVAVALSAIEAVLQFAQRHYIVAGVSMLLGVLLVLARKQFRARGDRATRRTAILVSGGLLAVNLAVGFVAVTSLDHTLRTGLTPQERMVATAMGMVGVPTVVTEPETRRSDALYNLLITLGVSWVAITGYLTLRSPVSATRRTSEDDERLRDLLEREREGDSLDYFATRDDREIVWAPGRRAGVSYRVVRATMLAAGDPVGERGEWADAISAFVARAGAHGWLPGVVACSEAGAEAWATAAGMIVREFGDEAVLRAATFDLRGRDMRNVRQAVNRADRAGVTVDVRRLCDLGAEELERLADDADRWRISGDERGFSMSLGRLDARRDPRSVAVRASQGGAVIALLVLVPWGTTGLSLDIMRRDPHTPVSGLNEVMIARTMATLTNLGCDRLSLNFAPFRDAIERSERLGAGPVTRLWGRLLLLVSRGTQADTLYRFNAKFRPSWEPRFIAYPVASALPRLVMAYLQAESVLRTPRITRLRRQSRARPTGRDDREGVEWTSV